MIMQPALPLAGNTNRRVAAKEAEKMVIDILVSSFTDKLVVRSSERYSELDGMLVDKDGMNIHSIFEIKCRNARFSNYTDNYGCSLFISSSKLNSMQKISEQLKAPSVLYNYTMEDGILFSIPITNSKGVWLCERVKEEEMTVPESIGGAKIKRSMSSISLNNCHIIKTGGPKGFV